jgi:hypothetical protein
MLRVATVFVVLFLTICGVAHARYIPERVLIDRFADRLGFTADEFYDAWAATGAEEQQHAPRGMPAGGVHAFEDLRCERERHSAQWLEERFALKTAQGHAANYTCQGSFSIVNPYNGSLLTFAIAPFDVQDTYNHTCGCYQTDTIVASLALVITQFEFGRAADDSRSCLVEVTSDGETPEFGERIQVGLRYANFRVWRSNRNDNTRGKVSRVEDFNLHPCTRHESIMLRSVDPNTQRTTSIQNYECDLVDHIACRYSTR